MPDENNIKELIEKGLSEKEIRRKLSISKTKLKEIAKKFNLKFKEKEKKELKVKLNLKKTDVFLLLSVVISIFLFRSFISLKYPPYSDDLGHMMRAFNLKQIVLNKEIPLWNNFVSSPTLLYRYPVYYLLLMSLMLFLPEGFSINILFLISQILTVAGLYFLLNELTEKKNRLFCSLCSILAVNNFFNIAWLGAWGGFYPMAFGISLIPFAALFLIKSKTIAQAIKYSPLFCLAVLAHPIVSFLSIPLLLVLAIEKNNAKNVLVSIIFGLLLSFFWLLPSFYEIQTVFSTYLKEYPILQEPLSLYFSPSDLFNIGNSFSFIEWFNLFTFIMALISIVYLVKLRKSILKIALFFALIPIITNLGSINTYLVKIPGYNLIVQAWRPVYLCIFLSCILICEALIYANAYIKRKYVFNILFLVLFIFSISFDIGLTEQIKYFFWDMPQPWTDSFEIIKNDNASYFRVASDVNSPAWVSSIKTVKPILSDTQTFFTPLIKEGSRLVFNNSFLSNKNWRNLLDLFAIKYIFIDKGFHYGYAQDINLEPLKYLDDSKIFKSAKPFNKMFLYQHMVSDVESAIYINNHDLKRAFFVKNSFEVSGQPECVISNFADFVLNKGLDIDTWPFYSEQGLDCSKINSINASRQENVGIKITEHSQSVELELNSPYEGYVVLKEFYHPAWQAFVNNKESEVLRALPDYLSVKIEEGSNKIKFVFNPMHLPVRIISVLISLICIFLYFFILYRYNK